MNANNSQYKPSSTTSRCHRKQSSISPKQPIYNQPPHRESTRRHLNSVSNNARPNSITASNVPTSSNSSKYKLPLPASANSESKKTPALLMLNIYGMDCSASSSLKWKVPYIEDFVNQSIKWYPIISITETWLKPHITDAQLHITGYNIYRSDRCHRDRGGSCLYIHESHIVSENFKFDNGYCEVVACVMDSAKSIIFSVYRPGDTPHQNFLGIVDYICFHLK